MRVWDNNISWLCYYNPAFNLIRLFAVLCFGWCRDFNGSCSQFILFVDFIHSRIIALFKIKGLSRLGLKLFYIKVVFVFLSVKDLLLIFQIYQFYVSLFCGLTGYGCLCVVFLERRPNIMVETSPSSICDLIFPEFWIPYGVGLLPFP